jgi:hypothetical protein
MVKILTVDIVLIGNIPSAELGPACAGIDGRDPAEVVIAIIRRYGRGRIDPPCG